MNHRFNLISWIIGLGLRENPQKAAGQWKAAPFCLQCANMSLVNWAGASAIGAGIFTS